MDAGESAPVAVCGQGTSKNSGAEGCASDKQRQNSTLVLPCESDESAVPTVAAVAGYFRAAYTFGSRREAVWGLKRGMRVWTYAAPTV